jgi:hypothetical protein
MAAYPDSTNDTGCLVCGAELTYAESSSPDRCVLCTSVRDTNVRCAHGHFVCDGCHALPGLDLIERVCANSRHTDPVGLGRHLMRQPALKLHGPEHHYLVPAVLLACATRAAGGDATELRARLAEARRRAEQVPSDFCGSHGSCGAAVGVGIFASVLTGATPLSKEEWGLSNLLTAGTLSAIAEVGGPRCCKRCAIIALIQARDMVQDTLGIQLSNTTDPVCEWHERNRQCLLEECPFYPVDPE